MTPTRELRAVLLLLIAVAIAVAATARRAEAAPCDPVAAAARAEAIDAHLQREARRAGTWDLAWGITYGALAAGQVGLVLAEVTPVGDYDNAAEAGLITGAIKSGIGSLSHIVLPLKIGRPGAPTGDACADLEAAERALRTSAANEKKSFYLKHVGSLVLNVAGLLYLGLAEDEWAEGGKSFALGYPVSLLTIYTMPRSVWHNHRRASEATPVAWGVGIDRRAGYTGVRVALTF